MPNYFVTVAAGAEDLLEAELRALGVVDLRAVRGGVRFRGEPALALDACLHSRTAMRVLMPLASFEAPDADALYEGVRRIPWNDHLGPRHTLAVDATGTSETLRHTHFTALKVKDAVCDAVRERHGARPSVDAARPDLRIVAHLARGRCDLSLDLSGEPLFKRGYRLDPTRASLKETLAAAILLGAGYDGGAPLHDPTCGSGTLAIEAALIAMRRAPGLGRSFGVERWPSFGETGRRLLADRRAEAKARERADVPAIVASDRDPEAVAAARANVRRAGVPVEVREQDAREIEPLSPPGFIVTNPPYGERLEAGGRKQLKTFFWQLGRRWRSFDGHRLVVLSGGPEFESAFGLRPLRRRRLFNGPIECALLTYEPRGRLEAADIEGGLG